MSSTAPRIDVADRDALQHLYGLLSRLWLTEIDAPLRSHFLRGPLQEAFVSLGGVLPEAPVEELAAQYCSLFIGPKDHLPPIQSVWQRSQLQSEMTTSVAKYADLLGYSAPAGEMLDHLGVQLGVMSHVISLINQNPSEADVFRDIETEFFRRHLSWPGEFLERVGDRPESEFYASMAIITRRFLLLESDRLMPTPGAPTQQRT